MTPQNQYMKHEKKFRMYDDDWDGYEARQDRKRSKKGKKKGMRGHARAYDELLADNSYTDDIPSYSDYSAPAQPQAQAKPRPFQYNESSTIEVKNYKIDLSRVKSITVEDTVFNGRKSYGIRFDFMGKKGYGRDVWYGTNSKQRDDEYNDYLAKWTNIQKAS